MSAYYAECTVSGIVAVCRNAGLGGAHGTEINLHELGAARIAMCFDKS